MSQENLRFAAVWAMSWLLFAWPRSGLAEVKDASVLVITDPAGATVWLDDRDLGKSPVELATTPGAHRLKTIKEGYLANVRLLEVSAGARQEIRIRLQPLASPESSRIPQPVASQRKAPTRKTLALAALGMAATGTGGYLLARKSDKAPSAGTIDAAPTGAGLMAATEFTLTSLGAVDPNGKSLTYRWDFGDGQSADGQLVRHVFNSAGTFNVGLTVNDGKKSSSAPEISLAVKNLTGTWRMTYSGYPSYYDMIFTLTQTGSSLSGTQRYATSSYPYSYPVTGDVSSPRRVRLAMFGYYWINGDTNSSISKITGYDSDLAFEMTRQ